MKWFRLYHDLVDDPKVQLISPVLFRHWVNILCMASQNEPRGTIPDTKTLAFRLKTPERKMAAVVQELQAAGLLDQEAETLQPHNWNGRQRVTDDVAKRVKQHRDGVSRNADVTLQETLPVTDSPLNNREQIQNTETETEAEGEKKTPQPPEGEAAAPPSAGSSPLPNRPLTVVPDRPPAKSEPYRLFQAMCEETGADEAAATKDVKGKQLGIAKHLIDDGFTEADVRGCIRYLQSQSWRTSLINLGAVKSIIGEWVLAGKPATAEKPAPNGRTDPRQSLHDDLLRIAQGGAR